MEGKNKKKGFTLAELLIVVAIIGVLVAISIPIFNKQLEKSRETHDIYTMRQAASAAIDLYYAGLTFDNASSYGLNTWTNGPDAVKNIYGYYDPKSGTFKSTKSDIKPYGKGTKASGGIEYTMGNDHGAAYDASLDYTDGIVMVAIYPNASTKHADIYWKNSKDNYIGGADGTSVPKLCIRVYLH